ncbi:hypothetical protein MCP_2037 [Methanocella paludicola SANAE]|uniref:Uncharacterized protein n=1 Tax=Methanocella paludicola (strain DSM 17711 / JCM 13418 / NBRC 101707 / SANAE) TaxID=304371 RepID=D1Z087_METPS|nr:hypothetical protein [Methanocella paludicola]BAI62109.1 hypothetical protein MCP_2037 [Methanocella paludicola SANAE]
MGSGDKPAGGRQDDTAVPAWKRTAGKTSHCPTFIVFLVILLLLVGLTIAVLYMFGASALLQYQDHQRGYAIGGMPASPTIVVAPNVPPNMTIKEKMKETVPIVGMWQSAKAYENGYWQNTTNYNLTIYNDNTFIINDRAANTYIIGKWQQNTIGDYSIVEPGRMGPNKILGGFYGIQFQYNDYGYGNSPDLELVDYERIYYSGIFYDLKR